MAQVERYSPWVTHDADYFRLVMESKRSLHRVKPVTLQTSIQAVRAKREAALVELEERGTLGNYSEDWGTTDEALLISSDTYPD